MRLSCSLRCPRAYFQSNAIQSSPNLHCYQEQGVPVFLEVFSIKDFAGLLEDYYSSSDVQVFRIFQSELLRRLRQGKPCEHQGHPDIRDAIEYHKRVVTTDHVGACKYHDEIDTAMAKYDVDKLKSIEDKAGRDREAPKFSARTLDIDIVLQINDEEEILFESDEIAKYSFVSEPLKELL